jgi:hypothetical protein
MDIELKPNPATEAEQEEMQERGFQTFERYQRAMDPLAQLVARVEVLERLAGIQGA